MGLKPSARADERTFNLCPSGTHGQGGEAELIRLAARKIPYELKRQPWMSEEAYTAQRDNWYFVDFNVKIDVPDQGRFFVGTGFIGKSNTCLYDDAGGMLLATFRALGINPEEVEFDEREDEKGNHVLLTPPVDLPMKVIVEVEHSTRPAKGDKEERTFANIMGLQRRK